MLKCINDFCVCLEKGRKHLKTRSAAIYWLNSPQFIWHSNHTTRLNNIVYTTAIACHLKDEEDDDIWKRIFSSSNSPPLPRPPLHQHSRSLVIKYPLNSLGHFHPQSTPLVRSKWTHFSDLLKNSGNLNSPQ